MNVLASWSDLSWAVRIALLVWVGATISQPIVQWVWGERAIRWGATATVALQAAAVIASLQAAWGWGWTIAVALIVMALGWAVEYLGSHTGVPFGRYHYTPRLQPQLGHVPLLIPVAWLMMLPASWAVAGSIARGRGPAFWLLSGLAITAWDFFLDPQMVSWGLWAWEDKGGYFGIPWVNFLGWTVSGAVMTAAASVLWPGPLPVTSLTAIYGLTWLLETVGLGVIWRQPKPALCGFLGMGGLLLWAWLAHA
jgi:putative membrane protein